MALLASLALLLFSLPSFATSPDLAESSSRSFHRVLLQCPERIWPGFDWADLQILLSDSSSRDAWLVGKAYPRPSHFLKDPTITDIFQPGFSLGFLEFRGLHTVAVNTDYRDSGASFRAAVNALFRDGIQSQWENPAFDDRGLLYPLLPEPRYLRRMLFNSLLAALDAHSSRKDPVPHLRGAAFWLRRWKKKYPEELAFRTEAANGIALYAEQSARLLSEAGCGARGEALGEAFRLFVRPELSLDTSATLSGEGAELGSLASFLLSRMRPGWQGEMNGSLMPVDLLLQDQDPVLQASDPLLLDEYRIAVAEQQRKAARRLEPVLSRDRDPAYTRVSVPATWIRSELGVEESYVLRSEKERAFFFLARGKDFSGEYGKIRMPSRIALHQGPNPCGGNGLYFLMPSGSISSEQPIGNSRIFKGSYWGQSFRLRGTAVSFRGHSWVCPWL